MAKEVDLCVTEIDVAKANLAKLVQSVDDMNAVFNQFSQTAGGVTEYIGNNLSEVATRLIGLSDYVKKVVDETDTVKEVLGNYIDSVNDAQNLRINLEV